LHELFNQTLYFNIKFRLSLYFVLLFVFYPENNPFFYSSAFLPGLDFAKISLHILM